MHFVGNQIVRLKVASGYVLSVHLLIGLASLRKVISSSFRWYLSDDQDGIYVYISIAMGNVESLIEINIYTEFCLQRFKMDLRRFSESILVSL